MYDAGQLRTPFVAPEFLKSPRTRDWTRAAFARGPRPSTGQLCACLTATTTALSNVLVGAAAPSDTFQARTSMRGASDDGV